MLDFSFFWYLAFTTGHTLLQFKDCDNLADSDRTPSKVKYILLL